MMREDLGTVTLDTKCPFNAQSCNPGLPGSYSDRNCPLLSRIAVNPHRKFHLVAG
jgi:hypothetical protein